MIEFAALLIMLVCCMTGLTLSIVYRKKNDRLHKLKDERIKYLENTLRATADNLSTTRNRNLSFAEKLDAEYAEHNRSKADIKIWLERNQELRNVNEKMNKDHNEQIVHYQSQIEAYKKIANQQREKMKELESGLLEYKASHEATRYMLIDNEVKTNEVIRLLKSKFTFAKKKGVNKK